MLKQKISQDLKESMKAGDSFCSGVLRMLLSAFHNKEIENRGKGKEAVLSEEETTDVLFKEVKKRKEAIETYTDAGREELAEKEAKELEIIKKYLPKQASEEEVEKIVEKAVEKIGAKSEKDFGKVMVEAMKELKGKAESSLIAGVIKKKISELSA